MTFSLIRALTTIVNFYVFLIIIYVLLSWFPHERGFMSDVYNVLGSICEPYLGLFRKIIPAMGGVDFSPVIAVIVLQLVVQVIGRLLL